MTKTIVRKTVLASFALVIIASGVIAGQNLLTTPNTAQAITPPDSCFAFNAGTGTITDYYNNEGNNPSNPACPKDVDIPGTIGGVAVTRIAGPNAYSGAFQFSQLTSVTIPSTVTSIGEDAFFSNSLASVVIENGVTSIGYEAFWDNELTSITIPSSVTTIQSRAFAWNQIATAIFEGSIASFGDDVFSMNSVSSITYGGTTYTPTTSIPEQCYTFSAGAITEYLYADINVIKNSGIGCLSREVDIPSTIGGVPVTSIGDLAFYRKSIAAVTIPNSVTSIGEFAFEDNQITSVTIPGSVTTIGLEAFWNNQLATVIINEGVVDIGKYAFYDNRLTDVSIPGSVTSIGDWAFYNNQLVTTSISEGVTSIGKCAFYNNQLTAVTIPASVTSVGDSAFDNNQLTSVVISEGVTSIGAGAFNRNRLTDVVIPNSVTSISNRAFTLQNPLGVDFVNDYTTVWYAQLYTADPTNPNNLRSGVSYSGVDNIGGHIINPSSVTSNYASTTSRTIAPSQSLTGKKTDGTVLTDYLVNRGPVVPVFANASAPTPEELTTLDEAFSVYYRLGDEVTLEAPASLSSLSLLRPASPHTLQLNSPVNTVNFVYGTPLRTIDFATPVGSATNPTAGSVPSNVTPLLAKSTFGVSSATACSQIQSASLVDGSDFTAPQTGQDVLGGLSFTIDCTASGGQADVSFALGGSITDLTGVKVYKQDSTNTITDITDQVQLTNNQTPDGTRTTISYSVTDGADLDDDGTVNGTIVDPIYLTAPTGTAISLLGASSTGALADTGMSLPQIAGIAILTLSLSSVLFIHLFLRPKLVAAKLKYRSLTRH